MKKYFYFFSILLLTLLLKSMNTKALETGTCILKQQDKSYEVTVPFYWYKVTKETNTSDTLSTTINYYHQETYINNEETCSNINKSSPSFTITQNILSNNIISFYYTSNPLNNSEYIYNKALETFNTPIDFASTGDYTISSTYLSLDNAPPILVSQDLNPLIIVSVDYILNANVLKNKIIAYDEVDGKVEVKIHENNYKNNNHLLGEYPIIFSATDNSDNTSYLEITIKVVDNTKPTIQGEEALTSYMSNPLTITQIKQTLIIIDNYDHNLSSNLQLLEDNFTSNEQKEGSYTITFKVNDNSNNESEPFTVKVTTYDDISPIIDGEKNYSISNKNKLDIENIKNQLIANDNIDKSPTIILKEDTYSQNYFKTGLYTLTFTALDKNNNESHPFIINIQVKDITSPIFYISKKFIGLDNSLQIPIEQLINIIEETNNVNKTSLLKTTILTDEYTPNKNKNGNYLIELSYEYENGEKIIIQTQVEINDYRETTPTNVTNNKKSFKTILKNLFNKIKTAIKTFFSSIFKKIKNLFK